MRIRVVALGMLGGLVATAGCDLLFLVERPGATPIDAAIDAPRDAAVDAAEAAPGCADGSREALVDRAAFPDIAGCAAAWSIGGVDVVRAPSCGRAAGNHGANLLGNGCNVSDVCADGWGVCPSPLEVLARIAPRATCDGLITEADVFFATRQSGPGGSLCGPNGGNDVFGCGTLGIPADVTTCAPLTISSDNDCFMLRLVGGWRCSEPGEATNIYKVDPRAGGGVLCCRGVD